MFERITTPEELFSVKLGSALEMERDSLQLLEQMISAAQRPDVKELLTEHAQETRQQILNVEECFRLLGEDINDSPSPTTKGLLKEAKATVAKTAPPLVDAVILSGGLEAEHYEIAVYEILVTNAEARGAGEVAALLRHNLGQEQAAGDKLKQLGRLISTEGIAYP